MMFFYENQMKYTEIVTLADLLKGMSIYFSKFNITDYQNNYYWKFVSRYPMELIHQKISLVSINYDCLLELALHEIEKDFSLPMASIPLMKIHGSCNYIPKKITGKGKWIHNVGTVINCGLEYVFPPSEVEKRLLDIPISAAIGLYLKGKKCIVGNTAIQKIVKDFQNELLSTDIVIIIGVKPNEEDYHIWDHIRNFNGAFYYIGGKEEFDIWTKKNRKGKTSIWISDKFHLGFNKICQMVNQSL